MRDVCRIIESLVRDIQSGPLMQERSDWACPVVALSIEVRLPRLYLSRGMRLESWSMTGGEDVNLTAAPRRALTQEPRGEEN